MAMGKNKKLSKKGNKKKTQDVFLKKVWYDVKAPSYFNGKRNGKCGKTVVTKTQGLKVETDELKGRVAEFNLADLKDDGDGPKTEDGHKKIKLEVQDISGKNCLTEFHGMSLTRDKMCNLAKKKYTLIDTWTDCKTADGYVARLFCLAVTKEAKDKLGQHTTQVKQFTYAQSSQIRKIRKKITQTLQAEVGAGALKDMVSSLVVDKYESKIRDATNRIYPLDPIHIYKVKLVKKPKLDVTKLWEIHGNQEDEGVAATGTVEEEGAKNLLAA